MSYPRRSAEWMQQVRNAFEEHGTISKAARALDVSHTSVARILKDDPPPAFDIPELPDEDLSTKDLLAVRSKSYLKRAAAKEAKRLIPVNVRLDGPIGIAHFGDPHVDDDGTNIVALQRHVEVVGHTEGMLAGNSGDTTNNWIGRLARLYGEQGTTAKQAWQLAEWLFTSMSWLFAIGGNHDCWSGAGDPLKWIARQKGVMYQAHGLRLSLNLPSGQSVILNARHRWRGVSQWNAAHGVSKAVQLGHHDHIVTAGDLHISGYATLAREACDL